MAPAAQINASFLSPKDILLQIIEAPGRNDSQKNQSMEKKTQTFYRSNTFYRIQLTGSEMDTAF